MLKPLPTRKIDAALVRWGTNLTHKDMTRLSIEPNALYIDLRDGTEKDVKIDDHETFVQGCKQLYGGNLNEVRYIEVFVSGYLVHLKTDVFDGDEMVCEVRVGGLC